MMNNLHGINQKTSLFGAVFAGGLASACCIGPFVFVALGIGSASFFMFFEPFRPLFMMITFVLLFWVGWQHWQSRKRCADQGCIPPKLTWFWVWAVMAILLLFSPSLLALFLQQGRPI